MRLRVLLILFLPLFLFAQNEKVEFSHQGGIYASTFTLNLSCDNPVHHIRYTLNGSMPTGGSRLYSSPLTMSRALQSNSNIYKIQITEDEDVFIPDSVLKAIVIRAAVFDEQERRVGPVVTQSYFIQSLGCDFHELPVVSICADSLALFSYDTGIFVRGVNWDPSNPEWSGNYYQSGEEWERLVNIEYYTPDQVGFNQMAGIRTHGGSGRRLLQKSFKVYAREEYGKKNFSYKVFDELDISKFKRLVFKPFTSTWSNAGVQDWLAQHIAQNLRVDALATRPVIVFINGEYWGIYYVEEKGDERYLESHYDIDKDDSNIIANWWEVENGSGDAFNQFYQWMETADLSDSIQYQYVEQMLDIPGTIDYLLLELFCMNTDWPANNVRCWQGYNGPWHWLYFDGDACFRNRDFNVYDNVTYEGSEVWPASNISTLFFRKLFQSKSFQKAYLNRLIELNEGPFSFCQTGRYFREISAIVDGVVDQQIHRFNIPPSRNSWEKKMKNVSKFLKGRPDIFWQETCDFFQIPAQEDPITELFCFPNPLHSGNVMTLQFVANDYGRGSVNVYDINGKLYYTSYIYYNEGNNTVSFDVTFPAGVYVLQMLNQKQKIVVIN